MATYKTVALVLRRIPLGEKDKIVTLFSRDLGKLRAVAKGSRKPTSKLSGASEPLLLLRASLAEGSSLDVLSEAEVREAFPKLKSDYGRFLRATYACELLEKVMEERDPHPESFDLLLSTLYILQHAVQADTALHAFELQLLAQIGYEPQLSACIRCDNPFDTDYPPVGYSPSRGGALCIPCTEFLHGEAMPCNATTILLLERLTQLTDAKALAGLELPDEALTEINRILRAHLRYRIEREIKSLGMLDALRLEQQTIARNP
ncbi:DNA repair protein RecO [Armatimonas sp.]|uniref:DNA repair protein RecO n=1 Tax=Armatimonas sp. TaxID=1872638 RepID=UPI00286CB64F|nr:DNA repair protein RecO [Armatimonas sp.]